MSSSWGDGGGPKNLDGFSGWSWGDQEDAMQTDQAPSDNPISGWGWVAWGDSAPASSSVMEDDTQHMKAVEHKVLPPKTDPDPSGGSEASGWELGWTNTAPTATNEPTPEQRRASITRLPPSVPSRELDALKENNEGRAPSVTPTELSSIGSHPRNLKFPDAMQAFKATVKTLQQATRRQLEYNNASVELDQWRKTRESEAYAHATLATRKKLDDKRIEIGNRQSEAQKKLKAAIDALAEISSPAHVQYAVNDSEIARYRTELQEWIKQANQHPVMQSPKPESPEEPFHDLNLEQQSIFTKDRSQWTVDDVKRGLAELESRVELLVEEYYCEEEYSKLRDESFHGEVDIRKTRFMESIELSSLESLVLRLQEKQQQVEHALVASADEVTKLMQERTSLKNELAASVALLDTLETLLAKLTTSVQEAEILLKQDQELVSELTVSVQKMLLTPPPCPKLKFDPNELLLPLETDIIPNLKEELVPLVEHFKSGCLQHDRNIQVALDTFASRIDSRLDNVVKFAQASKEPMNY